MVAIPFDGGEGEGRSLVVDAQRHPGVPAEGFALQGVGPGVEDDVAEG